MIFLPTINECLMRYIYIDESEVYIGVKGGIKIAIIFFLTPTSILACSTRLYLPMDLWIGDQTPFLYCERRGGAFSTLASVHIEVLIPSPGYTAYNIYQYLHRFG